MGGGDGPESGRAEENGPKSERRIVQNGNTENKRKKNTRGDNESPFCFAEKNGNGANVVFAVAFDIFKIFDGERNGVCKEKKYNNVAGKVGKRSGRMQGDIAEEKKKD